MNTFTIMRRRLHKACAKEILDQRKKEATGLINIGFYTIK